MTEAGWLASADPLPMLNHLLRRNEPGTAPGGEGPGRRGVTDRKLRLFACGCWRWWEGLPDPRKHVAGSPGHLGAVGAAERWADGGPAAPSHSWIVLNGLAARAAEETLGHPCFNRAGNRAAATALLRDVFGNPFRPPRWARPETHPWLAWQGSTAPKLAQRIYAERDFGALPVLADALTDAGCDCAELLAHLRGPGPHARGCWALDLLLGKE
jgi:hypothetical protein